VRGRGFTKRLGRWAKRTAADMDAAALALAADAGAARRLRGYQRDPHVAALRLERQRDWLDVGGWLFLLAGLAFTTVNVATFIGGVTGWLVEPLVMGMMLILMRGEQIANRYGEQIGLWVTNTRRAALLITYVMNTWQSWLNGSPKEQFIHSVPVIMVFMGAEALVQQRQALTRVVDQVGRERPSPRPRVVVEPVAETPPQPPPEPVDEVVDSQTTEGEPQLQGDLSGPRTLAEQAYQAYAALRRETGAIPTPSQVDDRAGVRRGTSKVTGRMTRFADRYEEEVSDGAEVDAEATG
jgi:hypothetical protein